MIITTPAGATRATPGAPPALQAALRTARKHASALFHRFVQARIATECQGPVRPLSRRGPWRSTL